MLKHKLCKSIAELSLESVFLRFQEINMYFAYGQYPRWALQLQERDELLSPVDLLLSVDYDRDTVSDEFLQHYRMLLAMHLVDNCKSFELLPVLSFIL